MNRNLSYFTFFLLGFIVCALTLRTLYGPPGSSGTATYAPIMARGGIGFDKVGSNPVRNAATKVGQYVVNIDTVGTPRRETSVQEFFGIPFGLPEEVVPKGQASGVIYTPDGYIITNNHVVDGAASLTVTTSDGEKYPARLIGRDPKSDLAIIKIDARKLLPFATFAREPVQIGDWVLAAGNALGLGQTVTVGIVSAKRDVPIDGKVLDGLIQTDAAINRGNSGGALADINGNLVGINTIILTTGPESGSIGIGFAIPSSHVANIAEQLVKKGKVVRPYMGIIYRPYDEDRRSALLRAGVQNPPKDGGAEIVEVVKGSPAERANLAAFDIILKINGQPVSVTMANEGGKVSISSEVGSTKIGDQVVLEVWHQASRRVSTVNVRVAEAPNDLPTRTQP